MYHTPLYATKLESVSNVDSAEAHASRARVQTEGLVLTTNCQSISHSICGTVNHLMAPIFHTTKKVASMRTMENTNVKAITCTTECEYIVKLGLNGGKEAFTSDCWGSHCGPRLRGGATVEERRSTGASVDVV